ERYDRDVTGSAAAPPRRPAPRAPGPGAPVLPPGEFLPLARATTKPPSPSTGRRVEGGATWHTGGGRAHCTGAKETGTAAALGGLGRLPTTPRLVRQHLAQAGAAPRVDLHARARDWSEIQERMLVPLYEAVHERLDVGPATRLLGLGCGS